MPEAHRLHRASRVAAPQNAAAVASAAPYRRDTARCETVTMLFATMLFATMLFATMLFATMANTETTADNAEGVFRPATGAPSRTPLNLALNLIAVGVGLFFIVSGVLKAVEPRAFFASILAYEIVGPTGARVGMIGIPPLEVLLGALAVVGPYRRLGLVGIAGLLAFVFLPAVTYAYVAGTAENCGCLGELVPRTPLETIVEDVVLIALCIAGWFAKPLLDEERRAAMYFPALGGVVVAAGATLLAGGFQGSFEPVKQGPLVEGVFVGDIKIGDLPASAGEIRLVSGDHLVCFFSVTCPHCQEAVPFLNRLAKTEGLPPVVGVCPDVQEPTEFIANFKPEYPIGRIGKDDFMRLMNRVPRVAIVRKGMVVKVYESIPTPEQVRDVIARQ